MFGLILLTKVLIMNSFLSSRKKFVKWKNPSLLVVYSQNQGNLVVLNYTENLCKKSVFMLTMYKNIINRSIMVYNQNL